MIDMIDPFTLMKRILTNASCLCLGDGGPSVRCQNPRYAEHQLTWDWNPHFVVTDLGWRIPFWSQSSGVQNLPCWSTGENAIAGVWPQASRVLINGQMATGCNAPESASAGEHMPAHSVPRPRYGNYIPSAYIWSNPETLSGYTPNS